MEGTPERPWLASYPPEVPAEIDPRPYENLNELFEDTVRKYGDRTAYVNLWGEMSYNELRRQVHALSSFFTREWGLLPGTKVAIVMPNLIQYPLTVFAILASGMTVVNINPLYTARELEGTFRDSGAEVVVVLSNFAQKIAHIIENTSIRHVLITEVGDCMGWRGRLLNLALRITATPPYRINGAVRWQRALAIGAALPFERSRVGYEDIAFLQYTGGTTGKPKGAMLSHGNILANVNQTLGMYQSRIMLGSETTLTPLPFYHIFALTINLMVFFAVGATNVLITDPRKLKTVVAAMRRYPEISIMTGVNTLYNALLNNDQFRGLDLRHLKLVVAGGAALQSGVDESFFKLTGTHILEGYGLTECSPLCCVHPPGEVIFNNSIGVPVPSTVARIVSQTTGEVITELNEPGELEFRGPQVMQGYYNRPEETASMWDGDFLRTGDVAVWDQGGFIRLIDRIKDMILVSGFNVFPSEIEDVVSHNHRVLECCAVGVPSAKTGEAVKLYVVKRDLRLTEDELRSWCRDYLTGYKVPKVIEFVRELPKTPVGKVLRRTLKEDALRQLKTRGIV